MVTQEHIKAARILIVDDEQSNVLLIRKVLERAGYTDLRGITEPAKVLDVYADFKPDLILLDLHMPGIDGFEVLRQLSEDLRHGARTPVMVITGDEALELKRRALVAGAKDFLTKPFDNFEVLARIWNLLETRLLSLALHRQQQDYEKRIAALEGR
jgi:putative two-component system response regulator